MDEKVNEILGNLYKDVKNYDQRINYHADIFIGGCNYEVLINDFLVHQYFGPIKGSLNTNIPINMAILGKGEQTWKVRIYPIYDRNEINGKIVSTKKTAIEKGARAKISIEGLRFKENGDIEKEFGKILKFEAPLKKDEKTGENIFADAGKPYVEYSGTFQADVPYELNGWKNSVDVSKENKEQLTAELLKEYEKYKEWLQNRELDKIALSKLIGKKEDAQAFFYNKKTNEEYIIDFLDMWGKKGLKTQALENIEIKYYGNNRVITLINKSYNDSPLWASYIDEENDNSYILIPLYFHRPKPGAPLEVIR
ncbi:hypothetical protein [Chryseobacterium oryctis]|uniref:Uncharacterized protein n=1 Tax=Chryseobacterium oryctis TaxID=2952618 RepID=A0ABT3HMS8_9FLAO|nr:hypothetical protein [Chryseobacterium oryctis]MCW3161096.1 hypothetical protein [Chryseobacterium oryctis]